MNIVIVLEQMCVMLLLILAGCLLFRKGRLNEVSSRHISGLVVNLCNPAVLVCSAFESGPRLSGGQLFHAFLVTLSLYALLTLLFYLGGFPVPSLIRDAFTYTGRATTFLSMIVLGISVAQMPLREIFCHKKDYLFVLLRMLLLPAGCVFLLRAFVSDPLLLSSSVLLLSVPCANLPLMCARENGLEDGPLARIIVLTTLLSAVTIPAVALLV